MFIVSGDGAFYTLQGEGLSIGRPAVFLRLHHCNLECDWCDAWYTWKKDTPEFLSERQKWHIPQTAKIIKEVGKTCRLLVITGGEPLLQQKSIIQLVKLLPDWEVEIETNGTILPKADLIGRVRFNCSPKLSNSGTHSGKPRIVPEVLRLLDTTDTVFKFVVRDQRDVAEMECDFLAYISAAKVMLMPEGTDTATNQAHLQNIAEIAVKRGYRVTTRLHVIIWGNTRRT